MTGNTLDECARHTIICLLVLLFNEYIIDIYDGGSNESPKSLGNVSHTGHTNSCKLLMAHGKTTSVVPKNNALINKHFVPNCA